MFGFGRCRAIDGGGRLMTMLPAQLRFQMCIMAMVKMATE
jgi:hypothetical protein